jgi:ribonucleoside-diphosphate reductase beta chain
MATSRCFAALRMTGLDCERADQVGKRDESRHIAYGVFLISRLVAQDKELWSVVESRMSELLPLALGVVQETDTMEDLEAERPFGMRVEEYIEYATSQFQKRIARIEKARYQTLEELYQVPEAEVALEES